ncbi:GGDEF domain-containing protein [uncultured Clostridium sp.]|uniref:GGDEF domain-containing protein n=1 Tax=uncultured Clostridium sp. TaxID=59620 RepID=UPI0025D7C37F|nr:GGDEF domain-containing protein [uncultured Clostridium sp.]
MKKCDKKRAVEISVDIYDKLKELEGFKGRIEKILNKNICIPDKYILTCSMGIISSIIDEKIDINDFIDKADKCLYEAKNSGKGRFVMYMDKS